MTITDIILMASTTVQLPTFLQELRFFSTTLPQQYRTEQQEHTRKIKASIIAKEIEKNRILAGSRDKTNQNQTSKIDVKREQQLKIEEEEVRARKQQAKKNVKSKKLRAPKKISKDAQRQASKTSNKNGSGFKKRRQHNK